MTAVTVIPDKIKNHLFPLFSEPHDHCRYKYGVCTDEWLNKND